MSRISSPISSRRWPRSSRRSAILFPVSSAIPAPDSWIPGRCLAHFRPASGILSSTTAFRNLNSRGARKSLPLATAGRPMLARRWLRQRYMLRFAREHLHPQFGARVPLVAADLQDLPFDGAFDGIVSTAAFHWLLDHDRLFRGFHRALPPGGWLAG